MLGSNRRRDCGVHRDLGLGLGLGQRGDSGLVLTPRLNLGLWVSVHALGLVDGVGRDVRGQGQVLVAGRRVPPRVPRLLPPRSVG